MKKEKIEKVIAEIMYHDGPDKHTDGSEVIADFIMSLLNRNENEWWEKYKQLKNKKVGK